jgi:hypothetical protein
LFHERMEKADVQHWGFGSRICNSLMHCLVERPKKSKICDFFINDFFRMRSLTRQSALQRSKSLRGHQRSTSTDLKKKPLFKMMNQDLQPKYEKMKCITMEVKRSNFGRRGWIAKPIDENLDLKQLQMNGTFEKLIGDLRVMELSGQEIPNLVTVRLDV